MPTDRRKNEMTIRKNIVTGALAMTGAVGLVACGGGEKGTQDVGTNATVVSRPLYARAGDVPVDGANVYVDQNENGKLDAFEPRAVTDKDGFFSYNHLTGTDYCASNVSSDLAKHCLRAPIGADAAVLIRVTGGYDTVTGRPFEGTLSLRARDLNKDDLRLVTPFTSLVATDSSGTPEKLQTAGILSSSSSLNDDYLASRDPGLAMKAAMVTKIIQMLGDGARTAGNLPSDLQSKTSDAAYYWLGEWVDTQGANFDWEAVSTPDVAKRAMTEITFRVLKPGEPMPEDYKVPDPSAFEGQAETLRAVVQQAVALSNKFDEVDQRLMNAILRAQSVLMERAANNPNDSELSDIQSWVDNQLSQPGGGEDLARLGGEDIDISALIDPSFNFDPASNTISASAVIPSEAAQAFASLVNKMFRINVKEGDRQGAALVFISGANGATSGELDVCVRYKDSRGDFNTGNNANPNGALLVDGSWSLLNNHTLTLNINVAGGVRPLLIKSVGSSGSNLKYRFNFGGDLSEWHGSIPEPFAVGAVPTNDATCQSALIEAFGPVT
jgi:hypothetical protein